MEHEYVAQCLRDERQVELVLEHLAQPTSEAILSTVRFLSILYFFVLLPVGARECVFVFGFSIRIRILQVPHATLSCLLALTSCS